MFRINHLVGRNSYILSILTAYAEKKDRRSHVTYVKRILFIKTLNLEARSRTMKHVLIPHTNRLVVQSSVT